MTMFSSVVVTDDLLHHLVSGSHAEATTRLVVAAVIEYDDRVLLIGHPNGDFDRSFELPSGFVLPGQTLLDALEHTVSLTTTLDIDQVTGYLGHHDHDDFDGDITRVFTFTVTVADPHRICRAGHIEHWWADPDDLPTSTTPRPSATAHTPSPQPTCSEPPLAAPLRSGARGLCHAEAATDLLIQHAAWLHRADFRDRFIHIHTDDTTIADIDWPAAISALDLGELPCSSGEAHMLRLAASLADGIPVTLCDVLTGLDTRNTHLISQAILHSNAWPDARR